MMKSKDTKLHKEDACKGSKVVERDKELWQVFERLSEKQKKEVIRLAFDALEQGDSFVRQ